MFEETKLKIWATSLLLSSMAGVAVLLRPGAEPLSVKAIIGAALNSGICGLTVSLFLMTSTWMSAHPEAVIGSSAIAGLGGIKTVDVLVAVMQDAVSAMMRSIASKVSREQDEGKP